MAKKKPTTKRQEDIVIYSATYRDDVAVRIAQGLVSTKAQHRTDLIADKAEEIAVAAYVITDQLLLAKSLTPAALAHKFHLLKALNK